MQRDSKVGSKDANCDDDVEFDLLMATRVGARWPRTRFGCINVTLWR